MTSLASLLIPLRKQGANATLNRLIDRLAIERGLAPIIQSSTGGLERDPFTGEPRLRTAVDNDTTPFGEIGDEKDIDLELLEELVLQRLVERGVIPSSLNPTGSDKLTRRFNPKDPRNAGTRFALSGSKTRQAPPPPPI